MQAPVVIVDDFTGDVDAIVDIAAALVPFPRAGNYYPGLRRLIAPADPAATAYVRRAMETAAPFIGGAFDAARFDLVEASFSMVVDPPGALSPPQRAPHFDSVDPDYLALLHYLSDTPRHCLLPPARDPDRAGRRRQRRTASSPPRERRAPPEPVTSPPPTRSSTRSARSRGGATGW